MEARTAYRGSGISKSFVGVMAVVATMGLGVTAGVVAKNLSAPAAPQTHIVQGLGGAAQENSARRGGMLTVADDKAAASAVGPDDRASNSSLTPAYQQVDTRGVKAAANSSLQVDTRGIIPAEAFGAAQQAPNSSVAPDAQDHSWLISNSFVAPDAQDHSWLAAPRTTKAHGYI